MTGVVLDASAVLALLFDEAGAESVELVVAGAVMSTVNWVEVCQRLADRRAPIDHARARLTEAGVELHPLTPADAERAAALRASTREAGLSLADRCCLALADSLGRRAVTADAAWASLRIGTAVELIR